MQSIIRVPKTESLPNKLVVLADSIHPACYRITCLDCYSESSKFSRKLFALNRFDAYICIWSTKLQYTPHLYLLHFVL